MSASLCEDCQQADGRASNAAGLAIARDFARDPALARGFDRAVACDLVLGLSDKFNLGEYDIKHRFYTEASVMTHLADIQIRKKLGWPSTKRESTGCRLLVATLTYLLGLRSDAPLTHRRAARDWLIACLEIAAEDLAPSMRSYFETLQFWPRHRHRDNFAREQELESFLAFLKEIAARERGESQPCEAFRVVRERR